jgi:hypothetical protein
MVIGTQIVDTMSSNAVIDYYTWGWDPSWDVVWMVVPTTPTSGGPQLQWNVAVERSSSGVTYHVTITNLTAQDVGVEGRYAIMNL